MVTSRERTALVLVVIALIVVGIFACGASANRDDQVGRPAGAVRPEPLFRALEPDLVKTCGGTDGMCHVRGSFRQAPTWLAGPDTYATIRRYRGILPATKDVGDSILLTQVRHAGPALADAPGRLFERVSDWLGAEVPGPPLPNTGAFTVQSGFNSVPLDAVASGLTDARVTFLASEANGTLALTALKLVAPKNANVKVTSPFFVIAPRDGKVNADPEGNGFKGELTAPAGAAVDLFTGKMILVRWDPTGRLKIAFERIESSPGQAVATGCTHLDLFKSRAIPAMAMPVDVLAEDGDDAGASAPLGQSSCLGCHAKEPAPDHAPGPAVQAMDLRAATADPAAACAEAKRWIDTKERSKSVILLNPTGRGNPLHPMKPITDNDPIFLGIQTWVSAEQ